ERLHSFEVEVTGSELEATLHEACVIARETPAKNVQRAVHPRADRLTRPQSILILEPGRPPAILTAFLIRDGRWLGRVAIGPRGGGLKQMRRLLEDRFFSMPDGPSDAPGDPVDLELVTRWLAAHRDDAVAFDPTDLKNADEVILRLEYFLRQGGPTDPDGHPVLGR
ncbi:MAG: hypothetical protein OER88_13955, partial [Planctomycetota bacterium]|nr:hypothetical protein [Planctomycetota bacterium]